MGLVAEGAAWEQCWQSFGLTASTALLLCAGMLAGCQGGSSELKSDAKEAGPVADIADAGSSKGPVKLHEGDRGTFNNIHIDSKWIYFTSTNSFVPKSVVQLTAWRMPKAGGPAEKIGPWSGAGHPKLFAADEDAVYWLFQDHINRLDKRTNELTELPLEESHSYGSLEQDEEFLYAVTAGCWSFSRIPKGGGALVREKREPLVDEGGRTELEIDEDHLYCSNGTRVVRISKELDGSAEVLGTVPGNIQGLAQDAKHLYTVENDISGYYFIKAWPKGGGEPEVVQTSTNASMYVLRYDQSTHSLYMRHGGYTDVRILAFDLESRELRTVVEPTLDIYDYVLGERFIYWLQPQSIMRMPK